ncbi:hypothetical protein M0811_08057 [Anaeramoeba ignava]|uniref:Uncharacterized protein n=1 Tax=Anaeramoeba ignava TaxID=1746090 RepID=A0A9Q0LKQ5_ANAIG|nr:hypothetical protein M0811_08057 [Anaeramoeba ignava]
MVIKFQIKLLKYFLKFDNDNSILEKFINICYQKPKEDVELVLNFLYTGFPNFDQFNQYFINLINFKKEFEESKNSQNNYYRYYIYYSRNTSKTYEIEKLRKFERSKEIENEKNQNEKIRKLFEEIGIDSKWIERKKGRKGIIKDFEKLYQENETKDFE